MANQEQSPSRNRRQPVKGLVISMFCTSAGLKGAAEVLLIRVPCWSEGNSLSKTCFSLFYWVFRSVAQQGWQGTNSTLCLIQQSRSAEFLDEPCDICTAEFLWSPALHQQDSRRFLKCLFSSAWFPTAGWSAGVRCRAAQLFPEREQAGALGAIPGQLRDQLNSQHSSHSPFEGKANKEGV